MNGSVDHTVRLFVCVLCFRNWTLHEERQKKVVDMAHTDNGEYEKVGSVGCRIS